MLEEEIAAMLVAYADAFTELDFEAAAALWDVDDPEATYVGSEYPSPLIGWPELERHWARLGARLRAASLTFEEVRCRLLADDVAATVMLSRWSFTGVESAQAHAGVSWVTAVVRRRAGAWRFASMMEAPTWAPPGEAPPAPRARPGIRRSAGDAADAGREG